MPDNIDEEKIAAELEQIVEELKPSFTIQEPDKPALVLKTVAPAPVIEQPKSLSTCPACGCEALAPAFGFYVECSRCESIFDAKASRTKLSIIGGHVTNIEESADLFKDFSQLSHSATVLGPFRNNRSLAQLEIINPAQKGYLTSMGVAIAAMSAGFRVTKEHYALELIK